jgi:hypothetical protein
VSLKVHAGFGSPSANQNMLIIERTCIEVRKRRVTTISRICHSAPAVKHRKVHKIISPYATYTKPFTRLILFINIHYGAKLNSEPKICPSFVMGASVRRVGYT